MTDGELVDAIDAVIYADVFDSAVTLEDAWRFARVKLARAEELEDGRLDSVLVRRGNAVALLAHDRLLDAHEQAVANADTLARRARRVARALRHTPFVRGIALTGSAAAGSADPRADVDLLVITADDRIGTVFLLLAPASRLLGRRLFCPNLYLAESSVGIEPTTAYVERELAQTRMLVGPASTLRDANPWLAEAFPNLEPEGPTLDASSLLQRTLERVVGGRLERWARRVAAGRLEAHYGGRPPDEVVERLDAGEALRFHRGDLDLIVPERYDRLRSEIEGALSAASARST